jgi:hypothetical protein
MTAKGVFSFYFIFYFLFFSGSARAPTRRWMLPMAVATKRAG